MLNAPPLPLAGEGWVGALSTMGFAERNPPRLALLGTLPRKREREGHTAVIIHLVQSPARRAGLRKPLANPHRQGVANLAIGLELLLAVAFRAGGVMGRPVFDVGGKRVGQFQRLVMRLRRQRDDEVEIEPLPVVELLEGGRL